MGKWFGPLLGWLAGVALQLVSSRLWPVTWAWAAVMAGSACLALLAVTRRRSAWPAGVHTPWRLGAAVLAAFLLGWGSTHWRAHRLWGEALPLVWQDQQVVVEGQVSGLPQRRPDAVAFELSVQAYEWQGRRYLPGEQVGSRHLPRRLALSWRAVAGLVPAPGSNWRMRVRLQRPQGVANPGGFDQALWLWDKGVRATGVVLGQPSPTGADTVQLSGMVERWRQSVRQAIGRQVAEPRAAGVLAGLAVGDQSAIDQEDWDVFRRTSVAHLISVSGLHITMVGTFGGVLIGALWRRSARLMTACPAPVAVRWGQVFVAVVYAVLAGWGVPAQRTVLMMAVGPLLSQGGRRWPWPLAWLGAAAVVTLMDPWSLVQPGFWLSFVAVGVLMSSSEVTTPAAAQGTSRTSRLRAEVRSMLRVQATATVALAPLAAVFFQQVSMIGFIANLLAIPAFSFVITPLALLGIAWKTAWSLASHVVAGVMKVLASLSAGSWAVLPVSQVPGWVACGSVLGAALFALPVPWRWRLFGLPAVLPLFVLPSSWSLLPLPEAGQFSATALDVGQGAAILIRTAGHALLFDTGPRFGNGPDAGRRHVLPALAALGVTSLDELVISHGDADHVGGARAVIDGVAVLHLRSSLEDDHPLRTERHRGQLVPHVPCIAGQRWNWDGVTFTVLHPTEADYRERQALSANGLSCVLKVQAAASAASVLLTGDIEAPQEVALVAREGGGLRSTLLLAPHHGSATSSTPAFLRAVAPRQIVIQAGRRNRYGHPTPSVLERYDALGLPYVATPACGAFAWRSDEPVASRAVLKGGEHVSTGQCWRERSRHYWGEGNDGNDTAP